MKNFVSILGFLVLACLSGSADADFSATSVTAPSTLDVGETPAEFKFQMRAGTPLVSGEKIVVTSDKAVWAAAAAATCTIDGSAQTADAAADATMKILTLTMTSSLLADAGTCASFSVHSSRGCSQSRARAQWTELRRPQRLRSRHRGEYAEC
jgi:hypothetical protein